MYYLKRKIRLIFCYFGYHKRQMETLDGNVVCIDCGQFIR